MEFACLSAEKHEISADFGDLLAANIGLSTILVATTFSRSGASPDGSILSDSPSAVTIRAW
jgi:hypothetical protein